MPQDNCPPCNRNCAQGDQCPAYTRRLSERDANLFLAPMDALDNVFRGSSFERPAPPRIRGWRYRLSLFLRNLAGRL